VNSEAIYGTRPISPYKDGRVCLTQKKEGGAVYAIYLADENETQPPKVIQLSDLHPSDNAKLVVLGAGGELKWKKGGNGISIEIPEKIRQQPPCKHAWTIRIPKVQ